MYGDTDAIRLLARRLSRQAGDIRAEAQQLLGLAEAVPWDGMAAQAMRHLAGQRCAGLRRAADLHDEASLQLHRHASTVDRIKHLISVIEHRVRQLVAAARARIASLAGALAEAVGAITPDPLDELLDRFVPPPPGHRDWLTVNFPGLSLPSLADLDGPLGAAA